MSLSQAITAINLISAPDIVISCYFFAIAIVILFFLFRDSSKQ